MTNEIKTHLIFLKIPTTLRLVAAYVALPLRAISLKSLMVRKKTNYCHTTLRETEASKKTKIQKIAEQLKIDERGQYCEYSGSFWTTLININQCSGNY